MLVDATLESGVRQPGLYGLRAILTHGFPGYSALTDLTLAHKRRFRGLLEIDEPDDEDDEDAGEDASIPATRR